MNGPSAYRRAVDLVEQAFEVTAVPNPFDPSAAPDVRAKLPDSERLLYIEAARVYAQLAQVAAIANHQSGESSTCLAEEPSPWDNDAGGAGLTWPEVLR